MRILLFLILALPAWAETLPAPGEVNLSLVLDEPGSHPFEHQMILATIRGLCRVKPTLEELKMRRMTDFDWMRLGQDQWSTERIQGADVLVMERRIAPFPLQAGQRTITGFAQQIEHIRPDGSRHDMLIRSGPVIVDVRPAPESADDAWLPVRALEVSDSWNADSGRLADGQSAKRRVVLRALGATPEMLPEQPPLRQRWLITFSPPENRSVQLTPEGPVTTVVWEWLLRPTTGEPGVLPEVTIPYFDTGEGRPAAAVLAAAPIGYESFSKNAAAGWRREIGGLAWYLGILPAAAILALYIASADRHVLPWMVRFRMHGIREWRARRYLRRCTRTGDARGFRRALTPILQKRGLSEDKKVRALLQPLDRYLFGQSDQPTGSPPDLRPMFRSLRKTLWSHPAVP